VSTRLTINDLRKAAAMLGCDFNVLRAVDIVESAGAGFDKQDRVKILFEPVTFNRMTKGVFIKIEFAKYLAIDLFKNPLNRESYRLDQNEQLRKVANLAQWAKIATEKDASIVAAYPNPVHALAMADAIRKMAPSVEPIGHQSTSWGRYQIMGFNFRFAGYRILADFVTAMRRSEADHLAAFCNFVVGRGLSRHLATKNFDAFFKGYNGPAYKQMGYDTKFRAALASLEKAP